jgi:UDP-glucose 4-epimerase
MPCEPRARVLVTGGAGFIGQWVVRALLAEGHEVTVAGYRPFPDPAVRSVTGDLRDRSVCESAVTDDTTAIIHLAGITSVRKSIDDPVATRLANVDVTARLLELAREHEVASFLLASTNAVVGSTNDAVLTEDTLLRPISPYGATKAAAEMLVGAYTNCYGIRGVSMRFSNVYGPGMNAKDGLIARLMRAARDAHGVSVHGSAKRDFVHVDDLVRGILTVLRSSHTGPVILGSGNSVPVTDVVQAAREVTGAPIPVTHLPADSGEMPAVILDISLARSLGHDPQMTLLEGLKTVWPEFRP